MDEYQQMIHQAKIMLRGRDRRQRERGVELLRRVADEAKGTEAATEANGLLASFEPSDPKVADPELAEFSRRWAGMAGFNDHRLAEFLSEMEARPRVAQRLRPEVIKTLQRWVLKALPFVFAESGAKEVPALNNFVNVISGIAAYEEVSEFAQLRQELFRLRLRQVAELIEESLKQWALDEAWRLKNSLSNGSGADPGGFEAEIKRLQDDIFEVDQQRKAARELLAQFEEKDPAQGVGEGPTDWPTDWPSDWKDALLLTELLRELRRGLKATRMPDDWRRRFEATGEKWTGVARAFIRDRAVAALSLDDLRAFWADYKRLPAEVVAEGLAPEPEWFQKCTDTVVSQVNREIEQAAGPAELTAISARLRAGAEGLPALASERIEALANEIGYVTAAWKTMQSGEDFNRQLPDQSRVALPAAFRAAAVKHQGWLDQAEAAFARLKAETGVSSEQACQDALETAEAILKQSPGHALARKLRIEAERRRSCYQLDEALARWDVAAFLSRVKTNNPGGMYAALAENREILIRLAALASQAAFAAWQEAAEWWREWAAANKELALARPEALRQAISLHEAPRREQWYSALDELLKRDLPPEEFKAAAASLEGEKGDATLHSYCRELHGRAAAGLTLRHIERGELELARAELGELSQLNPGHRDIVRLRTRLRVKQARADGPVAVAEALADEWHNVTRFVDDAHAILLETIRQVWEAEDRDSLEKLKMVMSQVFAGGGIAPAQTEELAEWDDWLRVEQGARSESSHRGVERLAKCLKGAERGELLNTRLKKLVSHWQSRRDTVILAWAYQAFRQIDPSIMPGSRDPAADLLVENDEAADRALKALASWADPGMAELRDLRGALQREEKKRGELEDFLAYLPHPAPWPDKSDKLALAGERLENLIQAVTTLEQLKEVDLRREANRERLDATLRLANRLDGVAAREKLKRELDRLEPLAGLYFLEQRIREAAEKCGSEEATIVLEDNLFAQLAALLDQVIERFAGAGAEGQTMWRVVSDDYRKLISDQAGILLPRPALPDLREVASVIRALHEEEGRFKRAIDQLEYSEARPIVPAGGPFEPENHLNYLRLIPLEPPRSRKVYLRFDRCAKREPMLTILNRSRRYLPDWVREYLDEGRPRGTLRWASEF